MDLKPGNFLLSYQKIENDELPIVKLCDFGLSRYTEGDGFTECT